MVDLKSTGWYLWHSAILFLFFGILCQSASPPANFNLNNWPMPTKLGFTRVELITEAKDLQIAVLTSFGIRKND
jgi:hypothetical protein